MVVLGGMGSVFGAVVGAAVLIALPQLLTVFQDYEQVVLGLVMMLVDDLPAERGIVPTLARPLRREAPMSILRSSDLSQAFGGVQRRRRRRRSLEAGRRSTRSSAPTAPARPRCST